MDQYQQLTLSFGAESDHTSISNIFIDNYMASAHGSYVKVYLFLLRSLSIPSVPLSISFIADNVDETDKDVLKALKYWERKDLLTIAYNEARDIVGLRLTDLRSTVSRQDSCISLIPDETFDDEPVIPKKRTIKQTASTTVSVRETFPEQVLSDTQISSVTPVFEKPSYSASQIEAMRGESDFDTVLNDIEDMLGKTLTMKDLQTPTFMYEMLGFPTDLIRFLYQYCIDKGKTSSAYIEKIAKDWYNRHIDTVAKASADTLAHSEAAQAVAGAFGISDTIKPAQFEYIRRWAFEYHMSPELIREACNRTVLLTGKCSFSYADGILAKWLAKSVKTMEDVEALDKTHETTARQKTSRAQGQTATGYTPNPKNRFNQYSQRTYTPEQYREFERRKLHITQ